MVTLSEIPAEEMAVYRATAQRRQREEQQQLAQRKARTQQIALQGAALLKEQFGANKVWLFGALAHNQWFSPSSDIDFAAQGIADKDFYRAVAYLQDLSTEFSVDLVDIERCQSSLRGTILREGKLI